MRHNQLAVTTEDEDKANAELIVKAVNAYPHAEKLAEALRLNYHRIGDEAKAALADWEENQ
jgi:hypothetical protein